MNTKPIKYLPFLFVLLLFLTCCKAQTPEVLVQKKNGDKISVSVEVMRTKDERHLGLMYRKSLKKYRGMLFIFEKEQHQPFTMKNTYIPLDMIFISRTKKIAGIVENTVPKTKGPYQIQKPSQYVLEVNAGFCRENGIVKGDSVVFERVKR